MLKVDYAYALPEPSPPPPPPPPPPQDPPPVDDTSKIGAHQFSGSMVQHRFQEQPAPQSIDEEIAGLKATMRNLPPEDQQAIQNSIRGLELTKVAADPAQVDTKSNEIIDRFGGKDNFDHAAAGRELAEIAKLSPQAGQALMDSSLGKINGDDKDEITQSFTDHLSDAELSKLAQDPAGNRLLQTTKSHLLEGKVHDDEARTGKRIDLALASANRTVDQQVEASAQRVVDEHGGLNYEEGSAALASEIERLNAVHGPEAGGKLIAKLFKDDPAGATNMLRFAGGPSGSNRSTVGTAMGQAYDSMNDADQKSFANMLARTTVADAFTPHLDGSQPTRLGELVASSFSTDFKRAVVGEMMNEAGNIKPKIFGDNGGVDVKALFNSAAIIAESGGQDLQVELFGTIAKGLGKVNLPSLTNDPQLKDRLSQLFINNGPEIIRANAPDGAFLDKQAMDGMVKFFELTLFSEDPGTRRQDLMKSVITTMQDAGDALKASPPVSQAQYEQEHGGFSQQDHVEAMGGLAATVWKAAQNQKTKIQADQKAREETAKLFVGMAFAFVPGAGDVIGTAAAEGGDFLSKVSDKAVNYAWDKGKGMFESRAQKLVNQKLGAMTSGDALSNIDTLLGSMKDTVVTINAGMPNDEVGELDLRSKFQSSFVFYNLISAS